MNHQEADQHLKIYKTHIDFQDFKRAVMLQYLKYVYKYVYFLKDDSPSYLFFCLVKIMCTALLLQNKAASMNFN